MSNFVEKLKAIDATRASLDAKHKELVQVRDGVHGEIAADFVFTLGTLSNDDRAAVLAKLRSLIHTCGELLVGPDNKAGELCPYCTEVL